MVAEIVLFGASGYSGLETARILARHPEATLVAASSNRDEGRPLSERTGAETSLRYTSHAATLEAARAGQVALLATPADTAADLAPKLLERGLRVVDLSGGFRLTDPSLYESWYGFTHPCPELLAQAHYGLVELFEMPEGTKLVSNPGCYATASILATAPLLEVSEGPVVIDGKSGVTGAGRKANEALIFAEVAENLRAYKVGVHQHTPEIERALSMHAERDVAVSFTAHLIPMRRGILVTAYLRAREGTAQKDVDAALNAAYEEERFVRVVDRPPETQRTLRTNLTEVGATLDPRTGTIIAFGAIDNLVKGAAGQAIQNLNRLLQIPPETGL